jgi:transcriptional regulator with XRE-family HTH domain
MPKTQNPGLTVKSYREAIKKLAKHCNEEKGAMSELRLWMQKKLDRNLSTQQIEQWLEGKHNPSLEVCEAIHDYNLTLAERREKGAVKL